MVHEETTTYICKKAKSIQTQTLVPKWCINVIDLGYTCFWNGVTNVILRFGKLNVFFLLLFLTYRDAS